MYSTNASIASYEAKPNLSYNAAVPRLRSSLRCQNMIQIGGLGVMTLTSFFAMFFMGNTSLYNQLVVRDMVSSQSLSSLLSTLLYILGFTLAIEAAGMGIIFLGIHGTMDMTVREELAFSAFHSISAFCNAGFSTLPVKYPYHHHAGGG